jgi:HEAT repeat protein
MLVFAFDRDWTVDVNPHPRREAVPLDWVRHLAHETSHAVYAIGNQRLAEEADIPGVVDIVGRHPDDWEHWLGGKQPDGRYERFPSRRERLALIADLHPDADSYIVVDDLDLGDVDGWEHYHAWDFVPAVRRGAVDPGLPWVTDPVTDGGMPTRAGIVPAGVSMLSSFLDEYPSAPGYELTYDAGGETRTRLLWEVSLDEMSCRRPSARSTIQCFPVDPGDEMFRVPVESIELLNVVEPPPERYTANADTPVETATALSRLAAAMPEAVRVSSVLTLLDREPEGESLERDERAVEALKRLAAARPDDCTPAVRILGSLLASEECAVAADALTTLRHIGEEDAGAIAPIADEIRPYLAANDATTRSEATQCIAALAEEYPTDVIDAVPALATILEDGTDGHRYAVYTLSRLTSDHPDAVRPVADLLGATALDESLSDGVRLNATAALGRVVSEYPSAAVDIVDDVAELLTADNEKLRNNAIGVIGDVAALHADVVEPHTDAIAPLLTVEKTYTRVNASSALSRVAEDFPAAVAHLTPTFVELLSDDDPRVRENACWALGRLEADEATAPLQERARTDEEDAIRTRAQWALAQIEEC